MRIFLGYKKSKIRIGGFLEHLNGAFLLGRTGLSSLRPTPFNLSNGAFLLGRTGLSSLRPTPFNLSLILKAYYLDTGLK